MIVVRCWVLMFAPYLWTQAVSRTTLAQAAAALPAIGLVFAVFCATEPRKDGLYFVDGWRWTRQAALVLLFTVPMLWLENAQ